MNKIVTPKGRAVWPHLNTPDTKFVAEGEYHTKLRLSSEDAAPLIQQLEKIRDDYLDEAVRRDAKVKQYKMADLCEAEVNDNGDLTGDYLFKFKQKAVITTRAGAEMTMNVALFDSQKKPTSVQIGGGSVLRISAVAIGYAMPSTKMVGLSLRPSAVQVIEVAGGANSGGDAFDVEDGFVADDTPAAAAPTPPPAVMDLGDDLADF